MRCVNCNGELLADKRFCPHCGVEVVRHCPRCHAVLQPSFRFCPDCGLRVEDGEAPLPEQRPADPGTAMPADLAEKIRAAGRTALEERKLVTVLFCDLVGSTAIAEGLDPEEYRDLLDRYTAIVFREIYALEGIVNQLAGDGVMALFGAPIAHEDAPQRAVRAALSIRDALAGANREPGSASDALEIRIGIHTGPVVVGNVGNDLKMDYTAIGDTTNLAARLQSLARPGTILVSDATYRLVRGSFNVESVGPFTVKGKREQVVAYEVLSPSEAATPMALAEARGMTPLVGRSSELTQLASCYERVGQNHGQVLAVVGEAGSGKSRLIYEFQQRLAGEPIALFEARCSALGQSVPYAPWIAMLRQHFALDGGDGSGSACEKIAHRLADIEVDREKLYPVFCHMLSVPGSEGATSAVTAEEAKRLTFDAVAHLVYQTSRRTPVVMIIEDLHWVDEPSREMIELAVSHIGEERIMLIVSHRPDYQPSWRAQGTFTQLNLRALGNDDATAIVRAAAGGRLPAALERKILAKAEGNPFFLEEITRALVEQGYLLRGDGHIRLTRPLAQIGIPDTIQELIGARLDRLGGPTKRVAQVAAVLGRQFHRAQLSHLLADEGIDVTQELGRLEARGLIHRKNVLAADEYRFGESLAQEVAYETLLLKERRQLHERIGLLLEASPGERDAERAALLAHHYTRSDNREKALPAVLKAAHAAEALPSYSTAMQLYRQAWVLADDTLTASPDDERVQRSVIDAALGLVRVAVLYGPAHLVDTDKAARRGRELAAKLGAVEQLAGLSMFHGLFIMNTSRERFAEGLALAEEALAIAQRAGLELLATGTSRGLAWSYLIDGQFALAQRTIDWVVLDLEQRGHRAELSDLYFGGRWIQGGVRYHSDELDDALAIAHETYELAVGAGNRTAQGGAAATIAEAYFDRADYRQALEWAEKSFAVSQAISSIAQVRTAAAIVLAARVELGESAATGPHLEAIEEGIASGGAIPLNTRLVIDALLTVGEIERARRLADAAQARGGGRLREVIVTAARGEVLLRLGPAHWPDAERAFTQALGQAQTLGARSTEVAALLGGAELAALRGDGETAARTVDQALVICRALGLHRARARAERVLADVGRDAQQLA